MTELSVYHQRCVNQARQRVSELAGKKTTEMGEGELLLWLTRMEVVARNLLNVVALLQLQADLAPLPVRVVAMTGTALAIPHRPETHIFASGVDPEAPEFVDMCPVCWEPWPCLIADLADLPGARPEPIDWDARTGPFDEEPPF